MTHSSPVSSRQPQVAPKGTIVGMPACIPMPAYQYGVASLPEALEPERWSHPPQGGLAPIVPVDEPDDDDVAQVLPAVRPSTDPLAATQPALQARLRGLALDEPVELPFGRPREGTLRIVAAAALSVVGLAAGAVAVLTLL